MRKLLKGLIFLIASVVIGYIPAFICVFAGSFILMIFGIDVSEELGNVILIILTLCIGICTVADMIGK